MNLKRICGLSPPDRLVREWEGPFFELSPRDVGAESNLRKVSSSALLLVVPGSPPTLQLPFPAILDGELPKWLLKSYAWVFDPPT